MQARAASSGGYGVWCAKMRIPMTNNTQSTTFAALLCLAGSAAAPVAAASPAKTSNFMTLYHFTQSQNGEGQVEGRLAAVGGVLYGAALAGGTAGDGTVFRFDLGSLTETTLSSFTGGKKFGADPFGPVSRVGTSVYGSTIEGHGTGAFGTIWRLNTNSGKVSVFHGFDGTDGSQPYSGVTPASGVFYGVTWYGGSGNAGTVFKLDASGKLTQLYNFPDSSIGCNPLDAVTLVGHTLYGTTTFCGANGAGTVYALDLDSLKASLLYSFAANGNGSAGANGLAYQNGALYGTTFDDGGAGTVYKFDVKTGRYSLLHQFTGGTDGGVASSGLTPLGGKLYGVTEEGGADGHGTIYSIDPATGSETVVYSFTGGTDGDLPYAGLLAEKGALYGSTLNVSSEYPNPRGSLFKFVP
jgi:uncharacterized repeat protein (TIGR03803 family)